MTRFRQMRLGVGCLVLAIAVTLTENAPAQTSMNKDGASSGIQDDNSLLLSTEAQAVQAVIMVHRDHLRDLRRRLQAAKDEDQVEGTRQEIKTAKGELERRIIQTRLSFAMAEGRLEEASRLQEALVRLQESLVRWQESVNQKLTTAEKSPTPPSTDKVDKGAKR